ncbi:hypothetical protein ACWGNE_07580 [Streptomyces xiamenensis]|uniref:hypothetical protein n=1 Tax=Streptomyces sp. NRRL F-2890 TaxID=1463845 RepID=UPI00131A590F|nr:hypothetical protein [Streptomyces sp. NRRL F-2890]
MRVTLRVTPEGQCYSLGLRESQRGLMREVLLFLKDRPDGDIASMVRVGVDRGSLGRLGEKLDSRDVCLSLEEVHIISSALTFTIVMIQSEREFFTRIGFFKEQAVSLVNVLARDIASAVDSR